MTTIVVARKGNKVTIAGDTLTTFGSTKLSSTNDQAPTKLFQHNDSVFGIAGSAATQLVMEELLRKHSNMKFGSRQAIYHSFSKIHVLLKKEAFLKVTGENEEEYESSQLTCLIANASGIFGVYSLREVFEYQKFWAIGSGMDYALGAMHTVYNRAANAERVAQAGVFAG